MKSRSTAPSGLLPRLLIAVVAAASCTAAEAQQLPLGDIRLPPGFEIEIYASGVENARQMALGDAGTLFVGSRAAGAVYAVVDEDGDNRADRVRRMAQGLYMPSGVAFRDGALYVAEVNRVLRYDGIEGRLDDPPRPEVVVDGLPSDRHHGWKYLGFGPDGKLYLPVGAPCNICRVEPPYGTILRFDLETGEREIVARGVRNSVGFDWHPETGNLWFTDNGRDHLGDERPPDELNRVTETGAHFGYPFCHGDDIPDPRFGDERRCAEFTPPAQELGPHVASIGMTFYTGAAFPDDYRNQILIAEHGSWNRSSKIGYRVTLVRLGTDNMPVAYDVFASGWLQGEHDWGRPADVEVMPDGAILVADDSAGVIYRIVYTGT